MSGVREFWSLKYQVGQILYCTALQMVYHCFNIYTSIPVYVTLALDMKMGNANS